MIHAKSRIRLAMLGLAVLALVTPACMSDGRVNFLGYTIGSMHDEKYRTVYVPIFENKAFQAGPLRGLEYVLTEAVQKEIERKTPYKVVSNRDRADTELLGTIVLTPKHILNRNQLNEIREAEMDLQVELIWRDLRTSELLSRPSAAPDTATIAAPETPTKKPLVPVDVPKPTVIQASAHFLPELGESQTTALNRACKRLAVQIVSLMEKPW